MFSRCQYVEVKDALKRRRIRSVELGSIEDLPLQFTYLYFLVCIKI